MLQRTNTEKKYFAFYFYTPYLSNYTFYNASIIIHCH